MSFASRASETVRSMATKVDSSARNELTDMPESLLCCVVMCCDVITMVNPSNHVKNTPPHIDDWLYFISNHILVCSPIDIHIPRIPTASRV